MDLQRALNVDWSNDIWVDKSKKQAKDFLFPFIATCLSIASSTGSVNLQSWLLDLDTHFNDVANDDGISIYDITEPQNTRYAFLFPGDNVLIDALQYHNYYYGRKERFWLTTCDRKAHSLPAVKSCLEFRPIPVEAMYDIWSRGSIKFESKMEDLSASVALDVKLTLKDQALARQLDTAFNSEDLNWMNEAELLPEFRHALKSKLYDEPGKVLSTSMGLKLLGRAFAGESEIDLSPFPLSVPQVQEILHQAWGGKSSDFRSLLMPDMSSITTDGLNAIVQEYTPSRLVLGVTAKVTLKEQLQIARTNSITELVSHALCKRSLEMTSKYAHKLPNISPAEFSDGTSQPEVSQVVFMKHFPTQTDEMAPRLARGGIKWSELTPDDKIWAWGEDMNLVTMIFPYRDAPIQPSWIPGLLPMLRSLDNLRSGECGQFSLCHFIMNVAKTYASAGNMVRPLPAELMTEYSRFSTSSAEYPVRCLTLGPKQWTLLITCESAYDIYDRVDDASNIEDLISENEKVEERQLRYAFVRCDEAGEVCVLNASDFLRSTLPGFEKDRAAEIDAAWQEAAGRLGDESPKILLLSCDAEEVQEALRYLEARDVRIDGHIEAYKDMLTVSRERQLADLEGRLVDEKLRRMAQASGNLRQS